MPCNALEWAAPKRQPGVGKARSLPEYIFSAISLKFAGMEGALPLGKFSHSTMSLYAIVLIATLITLTLYGIVIYNSLVTLKHNVAKAWANIDILLKQRHEELPKLVEVCKQYRDFEQATLQRVMEARASVLGASKTQDVAALGQAETRLRGSLAQLFAVAEAYPELRTNQQFLNLQERVSALETAIADRREFYNESVNLNNVRIEQFPDIVVARMFEFHPKVLLEFRAIRKDDVNLKAMFAS